MEYSDKELKNMPKGEADEELETDEQWKRWNKLRAEKHQEDLKERKAQDAENSLDALRSLRDSAKEEQATTVEIKGQEIRVLVDPDLEVWRKIRKIQKYSDKQVQDLPMNKVKELRDTALYVLGEASIDYSEDEWRRILIEEPEPENKAGLRTLAWLCNKVYETIDEFREDEKKISKR